MKNRFGYRMATGASALVVGIGIGLGVGGAVATGAMTPALAATTVPGAVNAGPTHDHGLTIAATPNPALPGETVLIYGQLNGQDNAGQMITLYHRVNPRSHFSVVATTTTTPEGFYEFTRGEGVVQTNRNWYVTGPDGTHSRTIHEGVVAQVSLSSSTASAVTGQPVVLSGAVSPSHPDERVKLQQLNTAGTGWSTLATTWTDSASTFSFTHRWAIPGDYTVRAEFPGDSRNLTGDSDGVTVAIQQKENPSFTIGSSAPIIPIGQSVTISGVLYGPGSTVPEPSTQVTLFGKPTGGRDQKFEAIGTTVTGTDGSYSFTETPPGNEVYRVEETLTPRTATAALFQGVQDALTINASSTTGTVGGSVTISGTVAPDKTGHAIELQLLGTDGYWHRVLGGTVAPGSAYSFDYTFGEAGTVQLRARIYGGPANIGAASSAVTITVTGVAPTNSLPPPPA